MLTLHTLCRRLAVATTKTSTKLHMNFILVQCSYMCVCFLISLSLALTPAHISLSFLCRFLFFFYGFASSAQHTHTHRHKLLWRNKYVYMYERAPLTDQSDQQVFPSSSLPTKRHLGPLSSRPAVHPLVHKYNTLSIERTCRVYNIYL